MFSDLIEVEYRTGANVCNGSKADIARMGGKRTHVRRLGYPLDSPNRQTALLYRSLIRRNSPNSLS